MASDNDGAVWDGGDPTEEVGPDGCEVTPDECEVDGDEEADEADPDDCNFEVDDELHEQFPIEPIPVVIDPEDGLPRPMEGPNTYAPPFTRETVICIEDRSEWVEMLVEELGSGPWAAASENLSDSTGANYSLWRPRQWSGKPGYSCYLAMSRYTSAGYLWKPRVFKAAQVTPIERWGCHWVDGVLPPLESGGEPRRVLVPVRPVRPRCKHYAVQCFFNEEQPDPTELNHIKRYTHCMRRRSVGGAHMSLRDQGVYACDHRDPPDLASTTRYIQDFDDKRLRERAHETKVAMFGLGDDDLVRSEDEPTDPTEPRKP